MRITIEDPTCKELFTISANISFNEKSIKAFLKRGGYTRRGFCGEVIRFVALDDVSKLKIDGYLDYTKRGRKWKAGLYDSI